jgi:hypothetical protein
MEYEKLIEDFEKTLSAEDKKSENRFMTLCKLFKSLKIQGFTTELFTKSIGEAIYKVFHKDLPVGLRSLYTEFVIYDIQRASKVLEIKTQPKEVDPDAIELNPYECKPQEIDEDFMKELE